MRTAEAAAPAEPGHADKLVLAWALQKFREKATHVQHLTGCPDTVASNARHGWECDCISDITRGDSWQIHITVRCPHVVQAVDWRWSDHEGNTSLPEIINELIELDKANGWCRYEDDDD